MNIFTLLPAESNGLSAEFLHQVQGIRISVIYSLLKSRRCVFCFVRVSGTFFHLLMQMCFRSYQKLGGCFYPVQAYDSELLDITPQLKGFKVLTCVTLHTSGSLQVIPSPLQFFYDFVTCSNKHLSLS